MNKLFRTLILLCLLLANINASEEMRITLKNNRHDIKGSCKLDKTWSNKLSCYKKFTFTFESKYHIFENYSLLTYGANVKIVTSLYNIHPLKVYADNKSLIHIVLNELDVKKIFETKSAKIIFSEDVFSENLLLKERNNIARSKGNSILAYGMVLKPTIRIGLNNSDLNVILDLIKKTGA